MKKVFLSCCVLLLLSPNQGKGWGFFGHRMINYSAVFTLPNELFPFYKQHIDVIKEQAVNADKRRYIIDSEAPRHYLDADFYEKCVPLDTIPRNWDSAISRYGETTVLKHGIVPWHIIKVKRWLTNAFKNKDLNQIIRLSADIGHYVADLHVPLHSTHNYNGQLTDQHGIHGLWESRLPELYSADYSLFVGKAKYINNISEKVWQHFEQSYAAKDSVLLFEKELNNNTKQDKKYHFEQRGTQTIKTYSQEYSYKYHQSLNNMVERRMRASVEMVGSIWFTSWVDAGQPDVSEILHQKFQSNAEDSININVPIKGRLEPH